MARDSRVVPEGLDDLRVADGVGRPLACHHFAEEHAEHAGK
jgi:hypothetical protein